MDLTPYLTPLAGGLLIGLATILMLATNGRILGVSGIFNGIFFQSNPSEQPWRVAFVLGLILAGILMASLLPGSINASPNRSLLATAVAGLLVGVGTQLGSGCTSGHGVCGIGRWSKRSIVATVTFMFTGFLTVGAIRHLLGGSI
jgi:uncharacterized membrane protein YedE/YeeE